MCIDHFYGYMRAVARASPRLPGTTVIALLPTQGCTSTISNVDFEKVSNAFLLNDFDRLACFEYCARVSQLTLVLYF